MQNHIYFVQPRSAAVFAEWLCVDLRTLPLPRDPLHTTVQHVNSDPIKAATMPAVGTELNHEATSPNG